MIKLKLILREIHPCMIMLFLNIFLRNNNSLCTHAIRTCTQVLTEHVLIAFFCNKRRR